jgi:hypothetical protein
MLAHQVRRRAAEALAESPVEVGEIAKSDREGHLGDPPWYRLLQQLPRAVEALAAHQIGERRSRAGEKPLHRALRQPEPATDPGGAQPRIGEVLLDRRSHGVELCGAAAARLRDFGGR